MKESYEKSPIPYGTISLITVTIILAGIRLAGIRHPAFQAVAHGFVGGLIGARIVGGPPLLTLLTVLLSAIELACFLFMPR